MNILENIRDYNIKLASASPRRRELLSQLGIHFSIAANINIDETYPIDIPVENVAQYISEKKAKAYLKNISDKDLIITADTVVINNGIVLGKPADENEAIKMLKSLSGHTHTVITAVTISTLQKQVSFSAATEVEFAQLDDIEIEEYVTHFHPTDKAGAYGIQEWIGCIGIKNITGSYYNVMGLPLHRLYTELKRF